MCKQCRINIWCAYAGTHRKKKKEVARMTIAQVVENNRARARELALALQPVVKAPPAAQTQKFANPVRKAGRK